MTSTNATIFYNGACPACRQGMVTYSARDTQGLFAWCDVSAAPPPDLLAQGVAHAAAKRRVHAIDSSGRMYVGIDVATLVLENTPRSGWLARLIAMPVLRPIADFLYDRIMAAVFHRWAEHRLGRQGRRRQQEAEAEDEVCPVEVYYNGNCPVCRPEIAHYRKLAESTDANFVWQDLAAHPDALAAHGIDAAAAKRRLHLIDASGELRVGIDAFIVLWARLPRYRRLARLVRLPGVHGAAAALYDHVLAPALAALNARRRNGS